MGKNRVVSKAKKRKKPMSEVDRLYHELKAVKALNATFREGGIINNQRKKKKVITCSACGGKGHTRRSKECPKKIAKAR